MILVKVADSGDEGRTNEWADGKVTVMMGSVNERCSRQ